MNEEQINDAELVFESIIDTVGQELRKLNDAGEHSASLHFAHRIIFESVIWSTHNIYESMGLLQEVSLDFRESYLETMDNLDEN